MALLAMLALAVLPTLSRAWGLGAETARSHALVEVCTAEGLRTMPSGDMGHEPSPAHHADAFEQCAHCVLGAAPLAPPSPMFLCQPPDQRARAVPALFLQAPHTLHAWAAAQPRAPPTRS